MYRPPENTNRVKSIKSRFETTQNAKNSGDERQLSRQLSDPSKRNIKRTPAFRIDLNSDKNFQRNSHYNRSFYLEKISALKPTCDTNRNLINKTEPVNPKPVLIKSKSSADFALIRSKFDAPKNADLYTEPVPKALRKPHDIYNAKTLKIRDPSPVKASELTDTLKAALKRPLPTGPAPRKPPRTFEHTPVKNNSFLHTQNEKKPDPRYMLSKLENALRNNKIKTRKTTKVETSTTSGEDSDDSVLFKSKSQRGLPAIPDTRNTFNLNCLNGCTTTYDKIKEANSEFFVKRDEPVYAEPFNFSKDLGKVKAKKSLYYMVGDLF